MFSCVLAFVGCVGRGVRLGFSGGVFLRVLPGVGGWGVGGWAGWCGGVGGVVGAGCLCVGACHPGCCACCACGSCCGGVGGVVGVGWCFCPAGLRGVVWGFGGVGGVWGFVKSRMVAA